MCNQCLLKYCKYSKERSHNLHSYTDILIRTTDIFIFLMEEKFNWNIVDFNIVSFRCTVKWVVYTYIYMHACMLNCFSMSNYLLSHELKVARLLCPWASPGKNTGVGYHDLLQGIFMTQGSNLGLLVSCIGRQVLYH